MRQWTAWSRSRRTRRARRASKQRTLLPHPTRPDRVTNRFRSRIRPRCRGGRRERNRRASRWRRRIRWFRRRRPNRAGPRLSRAPIPGGQPLQARRRTIGASRRWRRPALKDRTSFRSMQSWGPPTCWSTPATTRLFRSTRRTPPTAHRCCRVWRFRPTCRRARSRRSRAWPTAAVCIHCSRRLPSSGRRSAATARPESY